MKNEISNLIKLSNNSNINILRKNKNNWVLRDKRIILDDCEKMKKRKLKLLSKKFKNYSKENQIKTQEIKEIQLQTVSDLDNLDTIIDIVSSTTEFNNDNDFIEIYSN